MDEWGEHPHGTQSGGQPNPRRCCRWARQERLRHLQHLQQGAALTVPATRRACPGCPGCPGCPDASQREALEDRHIVSNAPLDKCGSALHYRLPGRPYRLLAAAINIQHQSGRSMLSPACLRPGLFRHKVDRDRKPQADSMSHGPWAMSPGPGRPSIIWLAIIVCSSATTHCHPTRTATRRPGGQFTHEPISSPKPVLGAWNPVLRLNRCHPC